MMPLNEDRPLWLQQCNAAREIRARFGTRKALGYLIGEKLRLFLRQSDRRDLATELPQFVAEIKDISKMEEAGLGYVPSKQCTPAVGSKEASMQSTSFLRALVLVIVAAYAPPWLQTVAAAPPGSTSVVELQPYGEPEDSLVSSSAGGIAVRFDMPFTLPYRITKIRFASATSGGAPSLFPSVRLIQSDLAANWNAPVFLATPYVGSADGMNEIASDIAVSDSGATFYVCFEFPPAGTTPESDYPRLRADLRDMDRGNFFCSYNLDTQHRLSGFGAFNVIASLVCEVPGPAPIPPAPQSLAMNLRKGYTEFIYTIPQRERHRVSRVDLLQQVIPGRWRVVGGSLPGSPEHIVAPENSISIHFGTIFAVRASDRTGQRSPLSDAIRTGNAYDRFEPNGSLEEATPAPSGPNQGGATIFAAGDLDYYEAWANPGDVISVTAQATWPLSDGLNDLDLVAYLLDEQGHVVASDDNSLDGLNPRIQYQVRPPSAKAGRDPLRFTVLIRDRRGSSFAPDAAPLVSDVFEQIYGYSIEAVPGPASRTAELQPRILGVSAVDGRIALRYAVPSVSLSPLPVRFFDVRGRLVRTLLDSPGTAERSVTWDRKDSTGRIVSTGIYYAVVETNGFRAVRKLVVAK